MLHCHFVPEQELLIVFQQISGQCAFVYLSCLGGDVVQLVDDSVDKAWPIRHVFAGRLNSNKVPAT